MKAVITGDIINSTKYEISKLEIIINNLKEELNTICLICDAKFELFKGDSFQILISDPSQALKFALLIKTRINKLNLQKSKYHLPDLRMAIGVGTISLIRNSISESNGQAFQFSGRTLDSMNKSSPKLMIKTAMNDIDEEFNVHCIFFDSISSGWSVQSSEVVYYLLNGLKEMEIANILKINQSAVNQRKKVAKWHSISMFIQRYQNLVNLNFYNH